MSRFQKYHLKWPWTATQVNNLDDMLGDLFKALAALTSTSISTSTASTTTAVGPQGIPGQDGIDGVDGPPGIQGPIGHIGLSGFGLPGSDGEDGQDSFIPGPPGAAGSAGAAGSPGSTGATGPMGLGFPGQDGEDGQDSIIPGPTGLTGATGAAGVAGVQGPIGFGLPGMDGEDGQDSYIPGPPGVPGATGAPGTGGGVMGPPGQDGESGDAFLLPFFAPPNQVLGCIVYRATGDQTVLDGGASTFYPVDFDTDEYDPASLHDTGSNISRIQIPVGGLYLVTYEGLLSASSTGQRVVRIRKNGTTDLLGGGFFAGNPSATWAQSIVISSTYLLATGDYIEIMVYQNSGISLTLYGSSFYFASRASIMKVG